VPPLTERQVTKFARLLGRQPTEAEMLHLYKVKDTLGLDENDETWMFVLALQHFEWLYERHPAQIAEAVAEATGRVKRAAEDAVKAEIAQVRGLLENEVAMAAASVAAARAETSRRLARWWAGAALTLFGGFALVCGFELGRGGLPFWMHHRVAAEGGALAKVAGAMLGAPAGWTALLLLLPIGVTWARSGWRRARNSGGTRLDQVKGWAILTGAILGWGTVAAVVASLVGGMRLETGRPSPNAARHTDVRSERPFTPPRCPICVPERNASAHFEGYKSTPVDVGI
jgi:hypothetical protein